MRKHKPITHALSDALLTLGTMGTADRFSIQNNHINYDNLRAQAVHHCAKDLAQVMLAFVRKGRAFDTEALFNHGRMMLLQGWPAMYEDKADLLQDATRLMEQALRLTYQRAVKENLDVARIYALMRDP